MGKRLYIYGNWSAYDELSDAIPLTEELAMGQLSEILRLRAAGVRIDAYLMDAFWFAPDGGYRTWRQPHWPDGPRGWLDACKKNDLIPGLWFGANTLCQIEPDAKWLDSVDENKWGLCCFHGGYLADYLKAFDFWYRQGVRIFKIDFADFSAAPPHLKSEDSESALPLEEIRTRNIAAFRGGLAKFKAKRPDAMIMAYNGFESVEYMDRTDRPLAPVLDLRWLEVFDSIYSGDPRPADVPAIPFWRSVDIYSDHTTRVLEYGGTPLSRIDNCGFMAGPTGTCYWRDKAMWKGMFLLTLARGGDLTVLYGDLSLFDDADARWMAAAQALMERAFASGGAKSFGGVPGKGVPYGWSVGDQVCVVVNPQPVIGYIDIPSANWQVLFADDGFVPALTGDDAIYLGPWQIAMLGTNGLTLGVSEDCRSIVGRKASWREVERSCDRLVIEVLPTHKDDATLTVIVEQRLANGKLVKTFAGKESAASTLAIGAFQDGGLLPSVLHHDRVVWSGMSWGAADIRLRTASPVRVEVTTTDPAVERLDLQAWLVGE